MTPTSLLPEFPEHELDQRTLDRLVDGELTASEYDELLRKLETAPAGWRRCALAFLEAQAWGGELRTSGPRLFESEEGTKERGTIDEARERSGGAANESGRAGG